MNSALHILACALVTIQRQISLYYFTHYNGVSTCSKLSKTRIIAYLTNLPFSQTIATVWFC